MSANFKERASKRNFVWRVYLLSFVLMSCAGQPKVDLSKITSAKIFDVSLSRSDLRRFKSWLAQNERGWELNVVPPSASWCFIYFSDEHRDYQIIFPGPDEVKTQDAVFLDNDGKGYVIRSFSRAALEPLEKINGAGHCRRVGLGLPSYYPRRASKLGSPAEASLDRKLATWAAVARLHGSGRTGGPQEVD